MCIRDRQQAVRRGELSLHKCPSPTNPADVLTKGMCRERITDLCQLLHLQACGGRAAAAPVRQNARARYWATPYEADDEHGDLHREE